MDMISIDSQQTQKAQAFIDELSELSRKHGIGIAGTPTLFILESEDYSVQYRMDEQSNLVFC